MLNPKEVESAISCLTSSVSPMGDANVILKSLAGLRVRAIRTVTFP